MILQLTPHLNSFLFRNYFCTNLALNQAQLESLHNLFFEILTEINGTQDQRSFCANLFQNRITPAPPFSRELQAYVKLYFLQFVVTDQGVTRRFQILYDIDPENFLKNIPRGLTKQTLYSLSLNEIDALIEKKSPLVRYIGLEAETIEFLQKFIHSNEPLSCPSIQHLEKILDNMLRIYPKLVLSFSDYIFKTPHMAWFIKVLDSHRQLRILFSYYPRFKEKIFRIMQERPDLMENLIKLDLSHLFFEFDESPLNWICSSFSRSPPSSWETFDPSNFRPFFETNALDDILSLALLRDMEGSLFLETEKLSTLFKRHEKLLIAESLLKGFLTSQPELIFSSLNHFERLDSYENILSFLILSEGFMELYHRNRQFFLEKTILELDICKGVKCSFYPLMSPEGIYSNVLDLVSETNSESIDPMLDWGGILTPLSQILLEEETNRNLNPFFIQGIVEVLGDYPLSTLSSFFLSQQSKLCLSLVLIFRELIAEKGSLLAPLMTKEHLKLLIQEEGFSKVSLYAQIFRDLSWSEYLDEMIFSPNGLFHLDSKLSNLETVFIDLENAKKKGWYDARLALDTQVACFDTVLSNVEKINDALKENSRSIPSVDLPNTLNRFYEAKKTIYNRLKRYKELPSFPLSWTCPLSMEMIFNPVRLKTVDPASGAEGIEAQIYDKNSVLGMIKQQTRKACSPLTRRLLAENAIIEVEDWAEQVHIRDFFESLP